MDAKQLFRLYHSKFHSSNWLDEAGELAQNSGKINWIYCGVGDDFKTETVSKTIHDFFTDDEVYLCISSNNSSLVPKSDAVEEIRKVLHKKEIGIMNKTFTKIMHFTTFGVFESGIIREFPASRSRPAGAALKVEFHANIVDECTKKVADVIGNYFEKIELELYKDYGGSMEHLWIDLDLLESYTSFPFRFQKRVSNPTSYTEFYAYNVGHYSVRPDFKKLSGLVSEEEICSYVFELLYQSTQILVDKQKKLDGFNATAFRLDFLSACEKLGYSVG